MKLRCLGDFVELRQGLAINKGSAHLVSDIQDITYCYPLLRIADMMDSNFSKFVSKDVNSSVIANPQDIIYTRTGQIGLAFRGMQGVVHNNSFIVSLKTDELEKDYLYTVLNSNFVKKQANSQAKNSVQPDLTHTMFKSIVIPVPDSREEQNRISKNINNINQKIRTNIQINQELEAMAKTLYDYWFVQFDFPDQNGKPYKSSGGKMVYHPELKREIPEGWGVENLFNVAEVQYGYPFSTDYFNSTGEGVPVIRIRDILGNDITNYSTEEVEDKYKINVGDVLIGMDGNFHMNYWIKEDCYLNQRVVKVNSDKLPNMVLKYQIEPFIKLREKSVSRTTVGHLSDKDLKAINVIIPKDKYLYSIFERFESILNNIIKNQQQNQELTQLRDWLLPMLMNGQVRVE
ncbi:Restriction modification system DNA specificity domain [Streptococcus sanguinis]|uniref:Restriction modification system DNA specificity domain n=1 Tax=Streptococcus sanguinis TaxID=1305 RepID=A0AAJ5T9Y5_STRSA|nr:restriction endonuclease subunit S [Streptococcus sanguinis]VDY70287.1 Restriction modification system DNA specificity domain [Streptococcus sanguinis]